MTPTQASIKSGKKETSLDKYAGKWVAFDEEESIVASDETLEGLMKKAKKNGLEKKVTVFLVPRKDEGPYILLWK